jgi:hypothetical protein
MNVDFLSEEMARRIYFDHFKGKPIPSAMQIEQVRCFCVSALSFLNDWKLLNPLNEELQEIVKDLNGDWVEE